MDYRSSFAVDKNNIDQDIKGDLSTLIMAGRVLWDLNGDYNLEDSRFTPPLDGLWNANGTIKVTGLSGCTSVSLEIWRSGELWFTVAERAITSETFVSIPYSCDMDCYLSSDHYFDLRIRLSGSDPLCTVSGSDEDTAWGMTFVCQLTGSSPT